MSPSRMLLLSHCMQSSLLSLSLKLLLPCANGVWVLGNFVAWDKRQEAVTLRICHPPYHPDDPECQLPSLAPQGVACHSGCGLSVLGIKSKSFPMEEQKPVIYFILLLDR